MASSYPVPRTHKDAFREKGRKCFREMRPREADDSTRALASSTPRMWKQVCPAPKLRDGEDTAWLTPLVRDALLLGHHVNRSFKASHEANISPLGVFFRTQQVTYSITCRRGYKPKSIGELLNRTKAGAPVTWGSLGGESENSVYVIRPKKHGLTLLRCTGTSNLL